MSSERAGIAAVWAVALLGAAATLLFAERGEAVTWLGLVFGGCVIATFAVQLATGRPAGYLLRAMSSIVGAMLILAVATALAALLGR